MISLIAVAALEIFSATGPAHWSECGSVGCYRQPPLPYQFNLDTSARQIGMRWRDAELAYHDLGRTSVTGTFVRDGDYDPETMTVRRCAPTSTYTSFQRTVAVTAQYAPRFDTGVLGLHVQPSAGLAHYRTKITSTSYAGEIHESGWTPVAGVRVLKHIGPASIGAGAEWYWRPRTTNSLAGGGSDHPVGLRTLFAELRYQF